MWTSSSAGVCRLAAASLLTATLSGTVLAQETADRKLSASDIGGVLATIVVPVNDPNIDAGTRAALANRMGSILSKGGLSGVGAVTPFVIYPRVAVLDATVVDGGLQAVTTAKVEVAFVVRHVDSGSSIHEWSGTVAGSGSNRQAAVRSAIASISTSDERLARFAQETRTRIVSHYEQNCTALRSQAAAVARAGDAEKGYAMLLAVPADAKRCQEAAAKDAEKLAVAAEAMQCERTLREARADLAANNFTQAALTAADVPPGTACGAKADALLSEIDQRARDDKSLQLRIESVRRERGSRKATSPLDRGRAAAASFFNRAEARTIRLDLLK